MIAISNFRTKSISLMRGNEILNLPFHLTYKKIWILKPTHVVMTGFPIIANLFPSKYFLCLSEPWTAYKKYF